MRSTPRGHLVVIISLVLLGGAIEASPRFIRGDADANGRLNLGDAVTTLKKLFAGGVELPCREAANSNADYIAAIDGAADLFVPASGHRAMARRFA